MPKSERLQLAGVCPVTHRLSLLSPAVLLSAAEMGADRGQLQAATRGQQPVPG